MMGCCLMPDRPEDPQLEFPPKMSLELLLLVLMMLANIG